MASATNPDNLGTTPTTAQPPDESKTAPTLEDLSFFQDTAAANQARYSMLCAAAIRQSKYWILCTAICIFSVGLLAVLIAAFALASVVLAWQSIVNLMGAIIFAAAGWTLVVCFAKTRRFGKQPDHDRLDDVFVSENAYWKLIGIACIGFIILAAILSIGRLMRDDYLKNQPGPSQSRPNSWNR